MEHYWYEIVTDNVCYPSSVALPHNPDRCITGCWCARCGWMCWMWVAVLVLVSTWTCQTWNMIPRQVTFLTVISLIPCPFAHPLSRAHPTVPYHSLLGSVTCLFCAWVQVAQLSTFIHALRKGTHEGQKRRWFRASWMCLSENCPFAGTQTYREACLLWQWALAHCTMSCGVFGVLTGFRSPLEPCLAIFSDPILAFALCSVRARVECLRTRIHYTSILIL